MKRQTKSWLPSVVGFSKSETLNHLEIKRFLKDYFPKSHLVPIKKIKYIDVYKSTLREQDPIELVLTKGSNIESTHFINKNTKVEWIEIYRQDIEGSSDSYFLKKCITHEIGHSVYENLSHQMKSVWQKISSVSKSNELISQRSAFDFLEDFCESYALYILDKNKLKSVSIDKLNFLKEIM